MIGTRMERRCCLGLLVLLGFMFATIPALSTEHDDLGIWEGPEEHPQNFLLSLCENYDLYIYDEKIDCYATQLVPKSSLWNMDDDLITGHVLWKREVDDQLEGSGSLSKPLPVEAPEENEEQINNASETKNVGEETPIDASEDAEKLAEADPQLPDCEEDANELLVDEKVEEDPVDKAPINKADENPVAVPSDEIQAPDTREQRLKGDTVSEPKENSVEEGQPQETDAEIDTEAESSVVATGDDQVSEDVKNPKEDTEAESSVVATGDNQVLEDVKDSKEDTEAESSVVATGDDQVSEDVKEPAVNETAQVDNQDVPAAEVDKPVEEKPTIEAPLSPFAMASLDTSNKEAAGDKKLSPLEHETPKSETTLPPQINIANTISAAPEKESELLDNKQSGSAVLDKEPQVANPSPVEGSDTEKHLSALSASSSSNNEPSAGESAENVSNRSKDATILVVLFVVVLVIGAAAFTHHFIKKRKQKNEEVKTLRNGDMETAKQSGDVEKGVEMKPLLNSNDKPVIVKEFSDTKKAVEA
ncbi:FK506-binding protein 5-like isoform X2 [Euwallacea similis]|uniref:FK506-binding protein 5-like isoform X2 n=1 Tax=Euwallacea similis TaxID=1736056 RepID=UPI00344D689C